MGADLHLGASNDCLVHRADRLSGLAGVAKDLRVDGVDHLVDPKDVTWDALAEKLIEEQTVEERSFREELRTGKLQSNNAKCDLRLFDAPEGTEPRVTFYRDTASWCPYCHKVIPALYCSKWVRPRWEASREPVQSLSNIQR